MKIKTNRMARYVTASLLLLGAGLAVFYMSNTGGGTNMNTTPTVMGALMSEERSYNFGTIQMGNGNVSHQFALKNMGEGPVMIEKIYTSCMCTAAFLVTASGERLGPFGMPGHTTPKTNIKLDRGESATLEAVFDPAAHGPSGIGLAQRSVYIKTTSKDSPEMEFSFEALVIP